MAVTDSYIFGIVANWKQKDAVNGVASCLEALEKRGQRYVIEERTAVWGNLKGDRVAITEMGKACDLVISFKYLRVFSLHTHKPAPADD